MNIGLSNRRLYTSKRTVSIKKQDQLILYFFLTVIYRILLDVCYFNVIAIDYKYMGFADNRNTFYFLLSWAILFIFSMMIFHIVFDAEMRCSSIIMLLFFIISVVPFTVCVYAGTLSVDTIISCIVYWSLLFVGHLLLYRSSSQGIPRFKMVNRHSLSINRKIIMAVGLCSLFVTFFVSFKYAHFRLFFDLYSVYDLRTEARLYAMGRITSYLFSWTRAINPILLCYCAINKHWISSALFACAQLFSFGVDGTKSTLFMLVLVVGVLLLYYCWNTLTICSLIYNGAVFILACAVVEKYLIKSQIISAMFVRRILFVPNYLNECYFDFFKNNTPDFFRSSFLRLFGISSPYTSQGNGITYLIGAQYFHDPTMSCNNGLFSDAVANLGIAGIYIMPAILLMILFLLDRFTFHSDDRIKFVVSFYFATSLISTFLTRVLLTHGLIVSIVVLSLIDSATFLNNNCHKYGTSSKAC